jgi:hypothetical protein
MNDDRITLPLTKGNGKNPLISDYANLLPVNMLAVPPNLVTAAGYMRSFPGLTKVADVAGISRGVMKNAADGVVYRVCGNSLYRAGVAVATIPGEGRVSLAGSNKTIAVCATDKMFFIHSDKTITELENWPTQNYYAGQQNALNNGTVMTGYDGSLKLTESMTSKGRLQLTITAMSNLGAAGTQLVIDRIQHYYDQTAPAAGTPYLTDVMISGYAIAGTTLTVSYTYNANGAPGDDATSFSWVQVVEPTNIKNAQYELGDVADITHANARYVWLKRGTNTFGVTDIEDETKPDRYRPFMTAEAFPDPAIGVGSIGGDVVVFGTVSTEFFSLTGSADTSQSIYMPQKAMMIPIGIAGVNCKAKLGEQFAVISHPAGGIVSVYLLGGGRATEIASREIIRALATATEDELAAARVEAFSFDVHRLIIIRFAAFVFCYDMTSKNWCQLCAGSDSAPHTATDFVLEQQRTTVADVRHGITGHVQPGVASQYGQPQEHILYTPMINAAGCILSDLELETVTGTASDVERMAVAATTDGATYPKEVLVISDSQSLYNMRPLLPNVGYVPKNIGFRFRTLSSAPFTASTCKVRIT